MSRLGLVTIASYSEDHTWAQYWTSRTDVPGGVLLRGYEWSERDSLPAKDALTELQSSYVDQEEWSEHVKLEPHWYLFQEFSN